MRKLLLQAFRFILVPFFISVCYSNYSYGQEVRKVPLNKIKKDHYLYVIGGQGDQVVAGTAEGDYQQSNDRIPAIYVDFLQETSSDKLLKPQPRSDFLYTFYFDGKLHALAYGQRPLDNENYSLQLTRFNSEGVEEKRLSDTVKMSSGIFRYDWSAVFRNYLSAQAGKWRRSYLFSHKQAPGGQAAVVMADNPFQTLSPRQLYFFTIDNDLSELAQHEVQLSVNEKHVVLEDYVLAEDGKVFFLVGGFEDEKFRKEPATFQYYLFGYDPVQQILQEVPMEFGSHFVSNLGLAINKEGTVMLGGLYNEVESLEPEGLVWYRLPANGAPEILFSPFEETMAASLNKQVGSGDNKKAPEFAVRYLFPEEDGSLTLFAEHYSRKLGVGTTLSLLSGLSAEPQLEDHYGDILAVRFGADGAPRWSRVIAKEQESVGENILFNSFAVCPSGNGYGLIFNEEIKSMSDVKWVSLDAQGNHIDKQLFSRTADRLRIAPMLAASTQSGQLIIPALRQRSNYLLSIKY